MGGAVMKEGKESRLRSVIKFIGAKSADAALLVFLLTIAATCAGGYRLYDATKQNIRLQGKVNAVKAAKEFDGYLLVRKSTVILSGNVVDEMIRQGRPNSEILEYMSSESLSIKKSIDKDYTGLYGWINGEYLDGDGWVPDEDYVPTERPWYLETIGDDSAITFVKPYLDAQTNTILTTVARKLSDGKSVIALDITLARIQEITEEIAEHTAGSYGLVLDDKGQVIAHSDPPGVITFTIEETKQNEGKATLRFSMKDTGIGMDREFIPKLFEAFSQEDTDNTSRYGGSGLGMAISKRFIEMMGGDIKVESEKGVGSTFLVTVTLGLVSASDLPAKDAEVQEEDVSDLVGLHLLIAEDQELNAEILADLVEMEGMSSEWAGNGQQAVEMFRQNEPGHFDMILMDMRMPVMDGLTATRQIRSLRRPDAASIPIIAFSANAFEEDVNQCLRAGMNAHFSKPVDIGLLKKCLMKYREI